MQELMLERGADFMERGRLRPRVEPLSLRYIDVYEGNIGAILRA